MKFKVGDLVVCVNNDDVVEHLQLGKAYKIATASRYLVSLAGTGGGAYYATRFEPANGIRRAQIRLAAGRQRK